MALVLLPEARRALKIPFVTQVLSIARRSGVSSCLSIAVEDVLSRELGEGCAERPTVGAQPVPITSRRKRLVNSFASTRGFLLSPEC